ncbi:hypothetical protein ACJX0J_012536, partial [Zea mays]
FLAAQQHNTIIYRLSNNQKSKDGQDVFDMGDEWNDEGITMKKMSNNVKGDFLLFLLISLFLVPEANLTLSADECMCITHITQQNSLEKLVKRKYFWYFALFSLCAVFSVFSFLFLVTCEICFQVENEAMDGRGLLEESHSRLYLSIFYNQFKNIINFITFLGSNYVEDSQILKNSHKKSDNLCHCV